MDSDKAARNLQVIRQLMERPVRYTTQSGLAAILAGGVTLAGMAADWFFYQCYGPGHRAFWINLVVWAVVFLAALAGTLGLTRVRELRQGMPFWTPAKRKLLLTVVGPFVAAAGLSAIMAGRWYFAWCMGDERGYSIAQAQWGLMFPCWMLFYGVACWQVSQFSTREIGVMGAAFILAGLVSAAFFQGHYYWTLGITFGGFHIVYGVYVWAKYGG
jgi:hypothetical protein